MLILQLKRIRFWEYSVYVVGLSITLVTFGGLLINTVLPLAGVKKPLSIIPLLVSFNIFLLILWIISFRQIKEINFKITQIELSCLNKIFYVIPPIFVCLSIFGAIMLNNNGPNYFTMAMFASIAIYIFLIVICKDNLDRNIYPYALLNISLALLLATSLRSWYVFGSDITTEYFMFQLTKDHFYWSMNNLPKHAYNACLSITIFPTILDSFLKINDQYIFKIFHQLIFIFTPIAVFLSFRRYLKHIFAFLACCFIIFSPAFFLAMPMHIRAEVALLNFSLMLLVLFNEKIDSKLKNILFILFGCSMAVSHYSTTYIALVLFMLSWLTTLIFKDKNNQKSFFELSKRVDLKNYGKIPKNKNGYLQGISIFLVVIFTFIWSSLLTETSANIAYFASQTINNIPRIFEREVRADGTSILDQFNIFYTQDLSQVFSNYTEKSISEFNKEPGTDFYSCEQYEPYHPEIIPEKMLPTELNLNLTNKIYLFMEIIKKIVKVFIIIGTLYLMFSKIKRQINKEYIILNIIGSFSLGIMMFLPFFSLHYDLDRAYFQLLFILSFSGIIGSLLFFNLFKINLSIIFISGVYLLYFLFLSGFIPQIIGGLSPSVQINNSGILYNTFYTHYADIRSGQWLWDNYQKNTYIYMGQFAGKKNQLSFRLLESENQQWIKQDIFPQIIRKSAYVYLGSSNIERESIFVVLQASIVGYSNSLDFLNENKNLIYNNKYTEIFK